MKDDFEHRSVDGATAPRLTGLGPNSPFAMAAQYLRQSLVADTEAPEPAITVAQPESSAPTDMRVRPLAFSLLPTGVLRITAGESEIGFCSASATRGLATWLSQALIERGAKAND